MDQPYVYIGAFLSPRDRTQLLGTIPALHSSIFADHVTLVFKPTAEDVKNFKFGETIRLNIIGVGKDEKGQAALVTLPAEIVPFSKNEHPHITISTAAGIQPVYSNELLQKGYEPLPQPFELEARIGGFRTSGIDFGTVGTTTTISSILLPSRPQADTILAIFLLRRFGDTTFPGSMNASITFSAHTKPEDTYTSLLAAGTLALDIGGGELDHHNKKDTTLSELVAAKLGIRDDPALEKLIQYVRRDDMLGKGTISTDAIDRAFGLSGLLATLNKVHGTSYMKVVDAVIPLYEAHYIEESKRTKEMPQEVEEKTKSGRANSFAVKQRDKNLKVMIIESDNTSLPGFLRSQLGGAFDVVAQWNSSGHLNILTRPTKRVDLRSLAALIRAEELHHRGGDASAEELSRPAKILSVPEWYYDTATNSLQNGGMAAKDVSPTKIERSLLPKILELGLSEQLWKP